MHYQRWAAHESLDKRVSKAWKFLHDHTEHHEDACLIWPFARKKNGYGTVPKDRRPAVASREMCRLAHGEPPTQKHEAAHSCGNGHLGCVNPKHLSWKTHVENAADMIEHGTRQMGQDNPSSKITEDDVRHIRQLYVTMSCAEIGGIFGLSASNIWLIATNKTWKHVS